MRRARERYRVYSEEEFFAEEQRLSTVEERCLQAGQVGGRRARGAHRLAGLAVLIGAVVAVFLVVAIDALPPAGGSRRRAASSRVARVGVSGPTVPASSLGEAQLPRGRARQSRRIWRSGRVTPLRAQLAAGPQHATRSASSGASGAQDGRPSVDQRGPRINTDDAARDRPSPGESVASRSADLVDREEGRRTAVVTTSDGASLPPREEFGFER
jgi:hypothetical protein